MQTGTVLHQLGLDRASVVEVLHERAGTCVCRITQEKRSYVLKWCPSGRRATEVRAYQLLQDLGVPTLRVHAFTDNALLLDDLATSPQWRLASRDDVAEAGTGAAVALWYHELHRAGRRLLRRSDAPPDFLTRECDALRVESILSVGRKLDMADNAVWELAATHIEAIKAAMRSLPETLNYNDFHWTNMALSRREPIQAVVFDYHLLGIGPAYSDYRNVIGSLQAQAAATFREAWGPVEERERILDGPVSTLSALQVAVEQEQLPEWARGLIEDVRKGELQEALLRAISILWLPPPLRPGGWCGRRRARRTCRSRRRGRRRGRGSRLP
ncbi:MAG: phosphotransferase [Candidatus Brocadiaceae bacterium]|nr:phosphotransferase [Candidatus Brocadiaceae bacterium]